jgi:hypothetical protein
LAKPPCTAKIDTPLFTLQDVADLQAEAEPLIISGCPIVDGTLPDNVSWSMAHPIRQLEGSGALGLKAPAPPVQDPAQPIRRLPVTIHWRILPFDVLALS